MLGSRPNILASVLDSAERQLGIDLRSTWALTVVRRSLEPLVIGLCLVGWLSTSLTVVGLRSRVSSNVSACRSEASRSRRGFICTGRGRSIAVFRIPVLRVQALTVGHEGEEAKRDPKTCSGRSSMPPTSTRCCSATAAISSPSTRRCSSASPIARAWRYHSQNPGRRAARHRLPGGDADHREPHARRRACRRTS